MSVDHLRDWPTPDRLQSLRLDARENDYAFPPSWDDITFLIGALDDAETKRDWLWKDADDKYATIVALEEALRTIKRVCEDYPARPMYACLTATEIAAEALKGAER